MGLQINGKITGEKVMRAMEAYAQCLDNPGFCIACGAEADGCEPDAREYACEMCGEDQVYGAEEVLMMM